MSVAAVMMVKDEVDIVGHIVRHLLDQEVAEVYVADNMSTDGTYDILDSLRVEYGSRVQLGLDDVVGYWQSDKTSGLARKALGAGHRWVIPCDADEWWYSNTGTLVETIDRFDEAGVEVIPAELYDHIPSDDDDVSEGNPVRRIGWRFRLAGPLPKVACLLKPDLVIGPGNHTVSFSRSGAPVYATSPGLVIRHFTWRTEDQYVRKIRNGWDAYSATDLLEGIGAHWRMFGDPSDPTWEIRVRNHFNDWFYSHDPVADPDLIFDPAP